MYLLTVLFLSLPYIFCDNNWEFKLPIEQVPYHFTAFPTLAKKCQEDPKCPYKEYTNVTRHWGYQYNHQWGEQYSIPDCPGDHKGWVRSKFDQMNTFYTQGDFGFVKQQVKELKVLCTPLFSDDSILECSDHMRYCRGRNLMINFTNLAKRQEPIRYKMDVLSKGDIGGHCKLNQNEINEQADHISALQSWGPEMRFFTQLDKKPLRNGVCDIVIEKPTYIMKIDAINMYHHFCDFFNLYASLHLNTHPDAFSTDVHILIWETFTYRSSFQDTWQAFTDYPLWDLKNFRGKTVCFKQAVFPLLPRMIFGLYYNTPIIYGCQKSGLFHAFSKFLLHRLNIPINKRHRKTVRVTLLSRDTKYRRILNEDELLASLKDEKDIEVKRVVYNRNIPFKTQLEITANTDVLIGIHGAGLTHLLFLPDWASVFELYNCEDANCYADLSRLRGVHYVTWKDTEKLTSESDGSHEGGAHAKFANYAFDVEEFKRLFKQAVDHVRNHEKFNEFLEEVFEHDEL
ncbi:EGF domain-specific O-linked N-acetylglucosamine transferase isoform X2 [Anthonomus grandis grandis]|uniref:EGF domain-specific O-linked N-acetylglucosamine transferase isoform X2 n=1 Tax=Anthonomus grandis grandis TaxID=2921223 RepID=UPI0021653A59|nr:EGF domain-specific O-linked N-acetylglucosamine transferase isoform X2 [Anthonomus grandis grandis]